MTTRPTTKINFPNNKMKCSPKVIRVPEVAEHVRQNQPRYLTLLLTSALGHLCSVPDKHCPICVASVVNPSALVRLITQGSTVADINYQTSGAFVQRKHGILQKAVDCYATLLNCSRTQWRQTFREIEICQCSMLLFVGVSGTDNFQDTTFSI